MGLNGVVQPQIIAIDENLRLRAFDRNYAVALPWYHNEAVYYNSEGITDLSKIPNMDYIKRMYDFLSTYGELYFIEVKEKGVFIPIGDVTLKEENPPIAIGVDVYRGVGIGKRVMRAIIQRAREIGIKRFYETVIYDYNIASQRLYESSGFVCVGVDGREKMYELNLT